jgi:hypothetical protein
MGFFDTLLGNDAADAARKAAADTYAKQQSAISGIQNFGNQYAEDFRNLANSQQGAWSPYTSGGTSALTMLLNSLGVNGAGGNSAASAAFQNNPGYQSGLAAGLDAINRRRASAGMLDSGNADQDAQTFGQNLQNQQFGNWQGQLANLAGLGANATGQSTNQFINTVGSGLQGQLGTQNAAFNGQMQSAGTIGQGDVAAAQAQSSALTNLLGMGTYLAGAALGGGVGGMGTMLGGAAGSAIPGSFGATSYGGAGGPSPLTGGTMLGRLLGYLQ